MFAHLYKNQYILFLRRLLVVMLLFSICRILFYVFNSALFPDMTFARLMRIMWGGLRFDLSGLLYVNLLFIFITILPFPFTSHRATQNVLRYIYVITNGLALGMNLADIAYFPFTSRRTTFSFFSEFAGNNNLGDIFAESIGGYWYLWLIWVGMIFVLWWTFGKVRRLQLFENKWVYYGVRTGIMCLVIYLTVAGIRGGFGTSTRPITLSNAGQFVQKPLEANIVLNTPFTIIRTVQNKSWTSLHYFESDAEMAKVFTPVHEPDSAAVFAPQNVVILILESFSREFVGALNAGKPDFISYTPFLDSLVAHSHAYCNGYANGRKSIDAMPSILAGIPTINEPFVLTPYSLDKIDGLGTLLKRKGYHTSFFHGAPNGSMGFSSISNLLGFEHYFGKTEYNNNDDYDGIWGIWDEPFLQFFAQKLNTFPQPFASALFTVSSHHPFKVPEKYEGTFPEGTEALHHCIGYSDYALRRFFDTASKMPWFENTLFVITADHGRPSPNYAEYQTSTGVFAIPIIYYSPKFKESYIDTTLTQQIDIMPTILGYLQYNRPYLAFGRDLTNNHETPYVFNYIGTYQLLYGTKSNLLQWNGEEKPGDNNDAMLFLKALLQQYTNRLIEDRLTVSSKQ